MPFPDDVAEEYMVVDTKYGNGESEATIPLGSWRKKDGALAGSKGHVYVVGDGWAGVWIIGQGSMAKAVALQLICPSIVLMQDGWRETTFKLPMSDLKALLPHLKAKKRYKASEAQMVAKRKGLEAAKAYQFKPGHGYQTPETGAG